MTKTRNKMLITTIILLFISIVFLFPTRVQAMYEEIKIATGVIDPGNFEPPALTDRDTKPITDKASVVTSVIGVIGIVVSVIALILIGIKFMLGSVEEKAEYKKSMIPYLIGVFIFFALTQLLNIIVNIAEGFEI